MSSGAFSLDLLDPRRRPDLPFDEERRRRPDLLFFEEERRRLPDLPFDDDRRRRPDLPLDPDRRRRLDPSFFSAFPLAFFDFLLPPSSLPSSLPLLSSGSSAEAFERAASAARSRRRAALALALALAFWALASRSSE
eukprot:Amastigsp_a512722_35.p5 type:complete len:137 gc:universal Amastigsp_a512722_35:591-181(-)